MAAQGSHPRSPTSESYLLQTKLRKHTASLLEHSAGYKGVRRVYVCVCVYIYICMYICMYVYICIYVYVCVCVYIYIYIERERERERDVCVCVCVYTLYM